MISVRSGRSVPFPYYSLHLADPPPNPPTHNGNVNQRRGAPARAVPLPSRAPAPGPDARLADGAGGEEGRSCWVFFSSFIYAIVVFGGGGGAGCVVWLPPLSCYLGMVC